VNVTYLPTADSACITEHDWRALETACRKARMHPIQMLRFVAGAAGIPVCRLGRTSLTRKQYQEVMVRLEKYRRRRGLVSPPPPAEAEDEKLITEQVWDLLQDACRDLGLESWQAQQVIAEATGISSNNLKHGQLTERQFMQVFGRLGELENSKIRPPLSDPPQPLARPYPQWKDARETDKPRKKGSKNDQTKGIPHWLWEGL
jgi:hypothetical protein